MQQGSLAERIERQIEEQAGLQVVVEASEGTIVLSGRVESAEARAAAEAIAAGLAPDTRIDNNLEVEERLTDTAVDLTAAEPHVFGRLPEDVAEIEQAGDELNPDFTDQPLDTTGVEDLSELPLDTSRTEAVDEADNVTFPPTDPVIATGTQRDAQVLGGFSATSMDAVEVEPSALDNQLGDEAIADAVRRELREDASTTDLRIEVLVHGGVVRLRGAVAGMEDAENAEDVASRVPGVREVVEELEVREL